LMFLEKRQGLWREIRSHAGTTVMRPINPSCKGGENAKS
jgi:hypothetical protein